MTIAVFGASGLVGTTVVERLEARGRHVVPVIHGSGSAWRLARTGRTLVAADLSDRASVRSALRGVTHVVNCTRGNAELMLDGLGTLLHESRRAGVSKFVHLSSVAVYGDPPGPDSADESGRTQPASGTYGALKLEQDRMVRAAARKGLSSVILCPPNVSGPHSYFLLQVRESLASGRFALLDQGVSPCNLVDVENLAYAVERAIDSDAAAADRYFITDRDNTTWSDLVEALSPSLAPTVHVRGIGREQVLAGLRRAPTKRKWTKSLFHPLTGNVRAALRVDPNWASIEATLKQFLWRRSRFVWGALRGALEGPVTVAKAGGGPRSDYALIAQQLRGVRHSCERACEELGYAPIVSFQESMRAFCRWYSELISIDADDLRLLGHLSK